MSIYTPEQEARIIALEEEVQTLHSAVMEIKHQRTLLRLQQKHTANDPYLSNKTDRELAAADEEFTAANYRLLDATKRLNEALNVKLLTD